ncbi:MAG: TonB-dependent receptor [Chitinophagaceae bacterium]|nr:TonB-dependent receptor [Chitinophagaceae bacterium]
MLRLLLIPVFLFTSFANYASTIIVKNITELNTANQQAKPGDIIVLKNGNWENVTIKLTCNGSRENPVYVKAETAGKVVITGNSKLGIGGEYIVVEGLLFTKGYAGSDAVITFRTGKDKLANNCQVTNCAIDDFNNSRRTDENYWVAFYGKNNRLDHSSFRNKKNLGVLLAVILDDERSRENHHSIDHNYFGRRVPLASNGGEIIRVGVSQHCQFNSNTRVANNYFDNCDGETEIVSIKSCSNEVEENIFKECQGSVVLRHGDNNTVAGNFFIGNTKPGTGGVRVINKGQNVISNIFFRCRGVDFRSPLAVMNGIPNSPAHRYVQVADAEIAYNSFYECSPVTFCEGSDTERTLPPDKVRFHDNVFYNKKDSSVYRAYDDISGIQFDNNSVSKETKQELLAGFVKANIPAQKPVLYRNGKEPEYPHVDIIPLADKEAYGASGAKWFAKTMADITSKRVAVKCITAGQLYAQLERNEPVAITLTGTTYLLNKPLTITKQVSLNSNPGKTIKFVTEKMQSVFVLEGNGSLHLNGLKMDGSLINAENLIASSNAGSSGHYSVIVNNCRFYNFGQTTELKHIFYAYKSMVADSISFSKNTIENNKAGIISMNEEKDDKGYYNAEKIVFNNNTVSNLLGGVINIYRGGNDESTMGPFLQVAGNTFTNCSTRVRSRLLLYMEYSGLLSKKMGLATVTGIKPLFNTKMRCGPFTCCGTIKS